MNLETRVGVRAVRSPRAVSISLAAVACPVLTAGSSSGQAASQSGGSTASSLSLTVVRDSPDLDDRYFNELAYEGAASKSRIVVAIGSDLATSLGTVAPKYPRDHVRPGGFAHIRGARQTGERREDRLRRQESGCLAGYLSDLLVKEDRPRTSGKQVVGTVAGQNIPLVNNTFRASTREPRPPTLGSQRFIAFANSQTFVDQAPCRPAGAPHPRHQTNRSYRKE